MRESQAGWIEESRTDPVGLRFNCAQRGSFWCGGGNVCAGQLRPVHPCADERRTVIEVRNAHCKWKAGQLGPNCREKQRRRAGDPTAENNSIRLETRARGSQRFPEFMPKL